MKVSLELKYSEKQLHSRCNFYNEDIMIVSDNDFSSVILPYTLT